MNPHDPKIKLVEFNQYATADEFVRKVIFGHRKTIFISFKSLF